MKFKLPIAITFVMGILMIIQFFVPHKISQDLFTILYTKWLIIIGAFFLVIGVASLLNLHYGKIRRLTPGWGYSVIVLAGIVFMCILGFGWGIKGKPFLSAYKWVIVPLDATMFSILGFYMASAAFRSFRARSVTATALLVTAIIVMIGRTSFGDFIWEGWPNLTEWIMEVPNMAQKRGILLGVVLGMLATSLRIIFGIERAYLGGGK